MLLCPVRSCHQPLRREAKRVVCERAHSFDIARSGYLNLLQPQDRRSKNPGDTPEAAAARRRLHNLGITRPLLDGLAAMLDANSHDRLLDAGCGEGFYLASLTERARCSGQGVDISVPAIDLAAVRYRQQEWIVANADRFLPFSEASFTAVLSITARMNPAEFHRVLAAGGRLLVAVAAPDDLIELRGRGKERLERTIAHFAPHFRPAKTQRITTTADLSPDALDDVLVSIYRPLTQPPAATTRITFSLDTILFIPDASCATVSS